MKLRRIVALPFAFVADAATLGNIGGNRSFTQQVFDTESRERRSEQELAALKEATRLLQLVIASRLYRLNKEWSDDVY